MLAHGAAMGNGFVRICEACRGGHLAAPACRRNAKSRADEWSSAGTAIVSISLPPLVFCHQFPVIGYVRLEVLCRVSRDADALGCFRFVPLTPADTYPSKSSPNMIVLVCRLG